MRREYVIFYSENHIFGNAIRRCLLDKNYTFLSRISIRINRNAVPFPLHLGCGTAFLFIRSNLRSGKNE